jgi:divinyl protochlorophyllide a 8-vinyl-reductase
MRALRAVHLAEAVPPARIGPNAIIQSFAALDALHGRPVTQRVFGEAGLAAYLVRPPEAMVDEVEVQRLHQVLRRALGVPAARAVGREAGRRTAAYLLAHRIPRPMRALLPRLPARWAGAVLLRAITAHAWTFCGSGRFRVLARLPDGPGWQLSLQGAATCRGVVADEPLCDYFAATFEGLFTALVDPGCRCVETACGALGYSACLFALRLSSPSA